MQNTIYQRIESLCSELGISKRKFEINCNLFNVYFEHYLTCFINLNFLPILRSLVIRK